MKNLMSLVLTVATLAAVSASAKEFHCYPANNSRPYVVSLNVVSGEGHASYKGDRTRYQVRHPWPGEIEQVALDYASEKLPPLTKRLIKSQTAYHVKGWGNDETKFEYLLLPRNWAQAHADDHFTAFRVVVNAKKIGRVSLYYVNPLSDIHHDSCSPGRFSR